MPEIISQDFVEVRVYQNPNDVNPLIDQGWVLISVAPGTYPDGSAYHEIFMGLPNPPRYRNFFAGGI